MLRKLFWYIVIIIEVGNLLEEIIDSVTIMIRGVGLMAEYFLFL